MINSNRSRRNWLRYLVACGAGAMAITALWLRLNREQRIEQALFGAQSAASGYWSALIVAGVPRDSATALTARKVRARFSPVREPWGELPFIEHPSDTLVWEGFSLNPFSEAAPEALWNALPQRDRLMQDRSIAREAMQEAREHLQHREKQRQRILLVMVCAALAFTAFVWRRTGRVDSDVGEWIGRRAGA
ncbi:hypothetical protein [Gemmatimonas aurantiaca]|uniref:hypothetical protein n=1 Tax=Gemmatimonas aurantiaca TaxID=173480 RepID=UPI00301B71A4